MTNPDPHRIKWFKPLHGAPKERQVLAFDCEGTGGAGGFICGAIVGDTISSFFTDPKEMFRALLEFGSEGYWIFSHNLQYDLPVLEGADFPQGDLLFTASTLLWADYLKWGRKVRIMDSANLYPRHTVEGMGAIVNTPKLSLGDELMRKMSTGWAWPHLTNREQEAVRKYVTRDAEIVYLAVSLLQDIALRVGGELHPTIAGVSMDIYRRTYHKWPWQVVGEATNQAARPAYYGGRVENFAYGTVPGVNAYDITSLYPFIQDTISFPHPGHLRLELAPPVDILRPGVEGVAMVRLRVPNIFIPPLPYRFDNRLFFPTGDMSGLWTLHELRFALDRGVELSGIDWALTSRTIFNPFRDFVESLYKLREGYLDSGAGAANVVKLVLNSLYGRFGLNPERGLHHLVNIENVQDLSGFQGYTTTEINNRLYAYGPIESDRTPDYVNTLFAAQITSGARVHLLEELERQGENAIYCDTDSILTRGAIETSAGLGGWRLEMENGEAELLGPKEYALHNAIWGERYIVKGVPERVAEKYFRDGSARFYKALGIREALAQGKQPATWVETYRSHGAILPKRDPVPYYSSEGLAWYGTRPYSVQELPGILAGLRLPREGEVIVPEKARPVSGRPQQTELELLPPKFQAN